MEYQDEVTGSATAMAVDESGTTSVDDTTTQEVSEGTDTATSFIRTEAAPAEVPKTLKHRGSITSIAAVTGKEKGTRGIEVAAHSDSNGRDYKTVIWTPLEWSSNVFITREELEKFPRPEGVTARGNPKQSPLERFGRTISSKDGSAELQRLLATGIKVGRVPNPNYTDFDTLVENLNSALNGTPVVFITAPDGEPDPQYGFRIKMTSLYAHDAKFEKLRAEDASGA